MGIDLGEMPHPGAVVPGLLDRFWSGVSFFALVVLPVGAVMAVLVFAAALL